MKKVTTSVILCLLAGINSTVQAQPSNTSTEVSVPAHRERPLGPPPEAYRACTSLVKGSACSMVTPRGETLSGTCEAPPGPPPSSGSPSNANAVQGDSQGLSCRPTNMPAPPDGGQHQRKN